MSTRRTDRPVRRATRGRRRGALRGLRAVPVPRVGAEEPDALAVRRARSAALRRSRRVGALVDAHRVRRRSRRRTHAALTCACGACRCSAHRSVEAAVAGSGATALRTRRRARGRRRPARAVGRGGRAGDRPRPSSPLLPLAGAAARGRVVAPGRPTSRGARTRRRRRSSWSGCVRRARAGRRGRARRRRLGRRARRDLRQGRGDGREHDRLVRARLRRRDGGDSGTRSSRCTLLLAVDDGRSSRCSTRPTMPRRAVAGCTNDGHVPGARRARRRPCDARRRRSSSTTTRRSRPRATAISTTPPRSTRSSRCACSP